MTQSRLYRTTAQARAMVKKQPNLLWIPSGKKGAWVKPETANKYWIKRYDDRMWKNC